MRPSTSSGESKSECGKVNADVGMRNVEGGKVNAEVGMRNAECEGGIGRNGEVGNRPADF